MKKFGLFAVLAFGGLLFAGCKDKEKEKEPEPAADPEATVLVDNTYQSFNVFGNNKVVNGEDEVDNDWAVKEYNGMTAISLKQAKDIDDSLSLYNTLKTKSIKGLYKFEGLVLGTKDAGWDAAKIVDGEKVAVNGSYAFKACGCDQNEDEEWVKTCHFPSAEAHGESLTPSTLFITSNMSDQAVDGFDHNSNPVALEAGVYTVVLATYKAPVGDMGLTCGLGLIKTANREAFVPAETYPVTAMDLAGEFNSWGGTAAPLTKNGNAYEGQVTLAEDGHLKVRLNNDWKFSLGAHALSAQEYQDNDANIDLAAGTYSVHVELGAGAYADFLTDKTIVSFTVTPANA